MAGHLLYIYTQSGSKLKFDEEKKVFLPNQNTSEQISVGSCGGDFKIDEIIKNLNQKLKDCLLYTSPSPRDQRGSRMPSSA